MNFLCIIFLDDHVIYLNNTPFCAGKLHENGFVQFQLWVIVEQFILYLARTSSVRFCGIHNWIACVRHA